VRNWNAVNAVQQSSLNKTMKTKNMTTLHLRKSIGLSPLRLGFLLIPLVLVCFGLSPAVRAENLPFQVLDEGTITFTGETTATLAGQGRAIRLGNTTSNGNLTIVGPNPNCIGGFSVEIQETFTAANGDQLTTTITPQLCPIAPGIYHGVGTYVVTGGTGRFAGATGSGVFDGTGDFNTGTIICMLAGTISINHH
jgi:hypothetical protein